MGDAEVDLQDIKGLALRGGLANLLGHSGSFLLRLGFMCGAARLLVPEDFGLVAMVTVFTAVLNLFATAGLSSATVQKATITKEEVSALFWINILVGVVLSLVCVLIAPLIVTFYHEPRLFWIMTAMGLAFLFNAAGVQPLALLQRQMRYIALSVIEVLGQLASLTFGIFLAVAGYGYWALVVGAIMLPATTTASAWIATAWTPARPSWPAGIGSMLHFGGTLTLNGLISYMTYSFDRFVLGRVWGASVLGYYGVASQLIFAPTQSLNTAVGGVMFSALSRLQQDNARFRSCFLKGYSLYVSMTIPITIFAGVFAKDIISVALGPQWAESAVIFRLLAPAVLILGMMNPLAWLLFSLRQHVRSLKIALVIAALVVTGCLAGLPYGPQGVAIGFSAVLAIWLLPHLVWSVRGTPVAVLDILRAMSRPLAAAIVATALAYIVVGHVGPIQSAALNLLMASIVMALVFSCLMIAMDKELYLDLLNSVRDASSPRYRGDGLAPSLSLPPRG
jgi:O-antigen/teichoic acid export membrane protein